MRYALEHESALLIPSAGLEICNRLFVLAEDILRSPYSSFHPRLSMVVCQQKKEGKPVADLQRPKQMSIAHIREGVSTFQYRHDEWRKVLATPR